MSPGLYFSLDLILELEAPVLNYPWDISKGMLQDHLCKGSNSITTVDSALSSLLLPCPLLIKGT